MLTLVRVGPEEAFGQSGVADGGVKVVRTQGN